MKNEQEPKRPPEKRQHKNRPITLAPLSFDEAIDRLVKAKPAPPKAKKNRRADKGK